MSIGKRIKERREFLGLTQQQLAELMGYKSKATINKIEMGKVNVSNPKILKFADILNTTVAFLMEQQTAEEFEDDIERNKRPEFRWIPIIANVAAGDPKLMYQDINEDDWVQVDYNLTEEEPFFALRIAGDSMEPEIKKGSLAIVRSQNDADNGDVVIVKINGDEATCKRIQKTGDGIMLLPSNSAYTPYYFSAKDMKAKPVSIIGKVMEVRTQY